MTVTWISGPCIWHGAKYIENKNMFAEWLSVTVLEQ